MRVTCDTCGITFNKRPAKVKRSKRHYCSHNCKHKGDRRRVMVTCRTCGKEFQKKAGRVSKDNYCDNICKFQGQQGEHAANWQGGVTSPSLRSTREYKKWRLNVYFRDGFSCQKCGSNRDINAHHIYTFSQYPEHALQEANGDTLCSRCHSDFHKEYGYGNCTAEDYWRWLND